MSSVCRFNPLQTMRPPWQAARRQKHWAIHLPSAGYRSMASVKTRTAWAPPEWHSSPKPGSDDICNRRCLPDACHDLPSQHRPASQRMANSTMGKVAWRREEVRSPCEPSWQFLRPPSPWARSWGSVLPSMPDGVAVVFQEAVEDIR